MEAALMWVRIDDKFPQHPKIAAAGPLAIAMQVAGLCYCNRELTDGFIPRSIARTLLDWQIEREDGRLFTVAITSGMVGDDLSCQWVIDLLVEVGMWEEVAGGFRIHDYLDYQPSRDDVLQDREKTAKRQADWRSRHKPDAANNDNVNSNGRSNGVTDAPVTGAPNPVPVPVVPTEQVNPPLSPQGEKQSSSSKPKTPRKQPETFVPDTFPLEAKHLEYAGKKGLTKTEAERETEKFLLWHGAKQSRHVDWYKAWQGWIIRASENKAKLTPFQKPDEEIPGHESWRNRKAVLA